MEKRKNHKYIARIVTGPNKALYFYSQAELDAYRNSKNPQNGSLRLKKPDVKKTVSEIIDLGKKKVNDIKKTNSQKQKEREHKKDLRENNKELKDKNREIVTDLRKKNLVNALQKHAKWDPSRNTVDMSTGETFRTAFDKQSSTTPTDPSFNRALVNPDYSLRNVETNTNCAYCTAAMDLRSRGYDVEAARMDHENLNDLYKIESWYVGGEFDFPLDDDDTINRSQEIYQEYMSDPTTSKFAKNNSDYDDLLACRAINVAIAEKYPEGASGHLGLDWISGGGHDVFWIKKDGLLVVHDAQTNEQIPAEQYFVLSSDVQIMRTDNLEPSDKIKETCYRKRDDKKHIR